MNPMAIAFCLIPAAVCGLIEGFATLKAVESVARQPEATSQITSVLLLGLALTETSAIYGFVIALIMLFS